MRIAYVLTTLAVGGTEKQLFHLPSRMAARGHTVVILVLRRREPHWLATDLDVVSLEMSKSPVGALAGLRRGVRFFKAFRPDIIHSHNFHGNMLARLMHLFHRDAKVISTIHNVYEGGRLRMLAYRVSDWLADRNTAVSVAVAERYVELKALARAKCVVIANGIEAASLVPDEGRRAAMRAQMRVSDEFVWLAVGRLTAAKDIPNLLLAFEEVCRGGAKTQLWIAGEAPDGDSGKKRLFDIEMHEDFTDKIRFLGLRRDVPALLDAADGFVLSSAWEGMPLAVGEAMAMEKPVVATDVGGVRELAGAAGLLVRAKDSAALAEAMKDVMKCSIEESAAMGRAARERILKHFSMDAKAKEWEGLYRAAVEA